MRRRSDWSARHAICSASIRSACPTRGLARSRRRTRPPIRSCRWKATACTRFRSARCMPASSSPAISVSPPMARQWCGSSSASATCTRASTHLMHGATLEQRGATGRPHLGRQHGRLCVRLRPRGGGGAGHRTAAARRLAARRDGGAGAHRQSPRRFRRDLQRRVVQPHAGALRHAARARAALCRRLLRPSPDDGPHRAGRRRRRSDHGWRRRHPLADRRDPRAVSRAGGAVRQDRVAAGSHRRHRHPVGRTGTPLRRRRLCRPRLGPRFRCAQVDRLSTLRPAALRRAGADRGRRQRARLDPHQGDRAEPVAASSRC